MRRWLESSASSCSLQAWPKEKRSPWFGRLSCECRTWWATSLSVLFHFKLLFLHCFIGPLIAWRHNFKCICRQQYLHIHQQPIRSVKLTFIMIKQRNHVGMLIFNQRTALFKLEYVILSFKQHCFSPCMTKFTPMPHLKLWHHIPSIQYHQCTNPGRAWPVIGLTNLLAYIEVVRVYMQLWCGIHTETTHLPVTITCLAWSSQFQAGFYTTLLK